MIKLEHLIILRSFADVKKRVDKDLASVTSERQNVFVNSDQPDQIGSKTCHEAGAFRPRGADSGSLWFQMEVIVGDFGIVVVPRDGADTERIMNHSSILRKYKVRAEPQRHRCCCLSGLCR